MSVANDQLIALESRGVSRSVQTYAEYANASELDGDVRDEDIECSFTERPLRENVPGLGRSVDDVPVVVVANLFCLVDDLLMVDRKVTNGSKCLKHWTIIIGMFSCEPSR